MTRYFEYWILLYILQDRRVIFAQAWFSRYKTHCPIYRTLDIYITHLFHSKMFIAEVKKLHFQHSVAAVLVLWVDLWVLLYRLTWLLPWIFVLFTNTISWLWDAIVVRSRLWTDVFWNNTSFESIIGSKCTQYWKIKLNLGFRPKFAYLN